MAVGDGVCGIVWVPQHVNGNIVMVDSISDVIWMTWQLDCIMGDSEWRL